MAFKDSYEEFVYASTEELGSVNLHGVCKENGIHMEICPGLHSDLRRVVLMGDETGVKNAKVDLVRSLAKNEMTNSAGAAQKQEEVGKGLVCGFVIATPLDNCSNILGRRRKR